jgi:hypothetical protein
MAATDDPELIKKAKEKAKRAQAGRDNVIQSIMGTTHGRSWAYEMLDESHIFVTSFITGNQDGIANALSTAFCEGERNRGLRLLSDIQRAAPKQYLRMLQEAKELEEAD